MSSHFQVRTERAPASSDVGGNSALHSRGRLVRHLEFRLSRLRYEHCSAVRRQREPRHQCHHLHVLDTNILRFSLFGADHQTKLVQVIDWSGSSSLFFSFCSRPPKLPVLVCVCVCVCWKQLFYILILNMGTDRLAAKGAVLFFHSLPYAEKIYCNF